MLDQITLVEAPTDRLLLKTLDRVDGNEIAIVDTPPGHERLLAKAIERADVVVIPTPRRRRRDPAGRGRARHGAEQGPRRVS